MKTIPFPIQNINITTNLFCTCLPLLVDDGYCVLQLDVVQQTGQEYVRHTDQTVILLLVEERIGTLEVGTHDLSTDSKDEMNTFNISNKTLTNINIHSQMYIEFKQLYKHYIQYIATTDASLKTHNTLNSDTVQ